ncbi:MAG: hypothetical protein FWH04_02350 [Oscillospiraceae bacterium]|nr:hypothetical protein [Oscillospiraceae bacterium]
MPDGKNRFFYEKQLKQMEEKLKKERMAMILFAVFAIALPIITKNSISFIPWILGCGCGGFVLLGYILYKKALKERDVIKSKLDECPK